MVIGERIFVDGVVRQVHVDDDGDQYVVDDLGAKLPGIWLVPDNLEADVPVIVD